MARLSRRTTGDCVGPNRPGEQKLPESGRPQARSCPRCLVTLVYESTRTSKGLSGEASSCDYFVCPACDAQYQYRRSDQRWRELS